MRRQDIDRVGWRAGSIRPGGGESVKAVNRQTGREQTYSLLVFSQGCVDDAHVEQDLGCVANLVELPEGLVELIVVVAAQGRDPRLDFL
jgi:hypothetical protein